jgi:hypothetical protein
MLGVQDFPPKPVQEPLMFRRQQPTRERTVETAVDLAVEEENPLRDEADPDPFIEAAAQRLRDQLSGLTAVDEWGRPVPWRQVARIALGPLVSPRVRDALTADVLSDAVAPGVPPAPERSVSPDEAQWRSFFRAIEEGDRLIDHQRNGLPEP